MEDLIYITIAKVLHGEANDAEREELDRWLASDPAHVGIFEEMKRTWSEADELFDAPKFDAGPAWAAVSAKIHTTRTIEIPAPGQPKAEVPRRGRIMSLSPLVRYSAAIAAILVVALLVWNPFDSGNVQVLADNGNMRIELPDHSIVTLRKGSSLSYPEQFEGKSRAVELEGEAFFEVACNERQPFIIDAGSVDVQVLGTTFNVRGSEAGADVAVATGRVQVSARKGSRQSVILTAGKAAHYRDGRLTEGPAAGSELYWKDGVMSFDDMPFEKVVAAIAAAKDTAVALDASFEPAQRQQSVTASFHRQPLEDILTELCLITNTSWQRTGTGYSIAPGNRGTGL